MKYWLMFGDLSKEIISVGWVLWRNYVAT